MTCQDSLELLGGLVDHNLDRRSRIGVGLHLLICRHCRRYFASYRATIRAEKGAFTCTGGRDADEPVPEIPDAQVNAILKAMRKG